MVKFSVAIESFSAIYVLKKLFDVVCYGTTERMSTLLSVDEDIRNLKDDFEHIKTMLVSVEEHRVTQQGLQRWLQNLKDWIYDAEDVVDEFETTVAKNPGLACINDTEHKQGTFERIVAPDLFEGVSQFTRLARKDASSVMTDVTSGVSWLTSLATKDASTIMTDVASGVSRLNPFGGTNTAQKDDVVEELETAVAKDPGLACSNNTQLKKLTELLTLRASKDASSNLVALKDDVVDELETAVAKDDESFSKDDGCILVRLHIAKEIRKILEELHVLMERKRNFDLSVILSSTSAPLQEGGSQRSRRTQVGWRTDYQFEMVGRVKEREDLLRQLAEETNTAGSTVRSGSRRKKNVSVTSIVGMGGAGKSTLAQQVYQEIINNHGQLFTLRKWVSVGESFDPKLLIAKLLGETSNQDAQLCDLQDRLIDKVKGQRFLIVLDDVWNTRRTMWEQLSMPLKYGSKGSRVLITCRDKEVVLVTGFKPTIELQPLEDDECMSIFLRHAFPEGDWDDYRDLKCVADKIVRKLKGLPLAAKVVGSFLFNNFDQHKWNNILEDELELWANVKEGEDSVMNQLKWSYNLLPPHLKQCFGFCSIYPKEHKFDTTWSSSGWLRV